jgi:F420-non-reducing hydrogenase large subunit
MTQRITIDPITRLEGHGKVDILLDADGNVADAYLQVVEFRGFEKFCEGRPVEELIRITPKICGVCPGAHHTAAAKACDAVYGVTPPPTAVKLRRLYLNAHIAHSHLLHFFALAAPDFIPGADAPKDTRNLLGLVDRVGKEFGLRVIRARGHAQRIQGLLAGHPIHPVAALPGGWARPLEEPDRAEIESMAGELLALAVDGLTFLRQGIIGDPVLREEWNTPVYDLATHYAGLVDEEGRVDFYDGRVRVIDPFGREVARFLAAEYLEHIAEKVLPWSWLKVPYLKKVGWAGIRDGADSGIFRVNSLARLNVATAMATPLAERARREMFERYGSAPVHHTLGYHEARLIETVQAAETVFSLSRDPEITGREVRVVPTGRPSEGVGVVEAPRGTLYHHYVTDGAGMVKSVNLIVATAQNNAAMNLSVKRAANALIHGGVVDDRLTDRVEMAFRAYDPCLACATHHRPGRMPLAVRVHRP